MKLFKILTVLLIVFSLAFSVTAQEAETPSVFAELEGIDFYFSSGVGGWFTFMQISSDGSFTGQFHDSEMGDMGDDYPNGSVYGCAFHGKLSVIEQLTDTMWSLSIDELELDEGQLDTYIEDGTRFITVTDIYGLENTDSLVLYTPGTPMGYIAEGYLMWAHLYDETPLSFPYYGLYNVPEECGFVGIPDTDAA